MSEGVVCRTIVVLDSDNRLLYGHSIFWKLSALDYVVRSWKKKKFGHIAVYFSDLDEFEIHSVMESRQLVLNFESESIVVVIPSESEEAFLEQSYDADEYNPFGSLCAAVKYFFPANAKFDADYLSDNKERFAQIESEFGLSVSTCPHLLETFSVYTPIRLEEDFRGIEDHRGTGYEIAFSDPFSLYQGANVLVQAMTDGAVNEHSYSLDKEQHVVVTGSVPDSVVTSVTFAGKLVFRSSFSLLKKISISSSIVSQRHVEHKGEVITQSIIEKRSFDV